MTRMQWTRAGAEPAWRDLFAIADNGQPATQVVALAPGAMLIRGVAAPQAENVFADLQRVLAAAPPRHMVTPGGFRMSVAMTNCGPRGWVSDVEGYRYDAIDPDSGQPWPALPASFVELAQRVGKEAGYGGFVPDACLVSQYGPGARLTLHQDRDEQDFGHPIVSISLGLPAVFLFGGLKRSEKVKRVALSHGDAVIWGGPARLRYHGVSALGDGLHPLVGRFRFNLSFRRAA